jgi:hypothetical protein
MFARRAMDNQQEQAREKNKLCQPATGSRTSEMSASRRTQLERDQRRIASLERNMHVHLWGIGANNDALCAVRYRINTEKS